MTDSDPLEHITFCPRARGVPLATGSEAEGDVARFLAHNLPPRAGSFHILVNYNMPVDGPGAHGTLEIDNLLIDRYGVFVLEVKNWRGQVQAFDNGWVQGEGWLRGNPFASVENKARVLHGSWFGRGKPLGEMYAPVTGLVVLYQGKASFTAHAKLPAGRVVGVDSELILATAPPDGRHGAAGCLSDDQIGQVVRTLYRQHEPSTVATIGDYRIVNKLVPGDLFEAFEAESIHVPSMRVRIKVYTLPGFRGAPQDQVKEFKRSTVAYARMGSHPNILQTLNFFPDPDNPFRFYEITELPHGQRLDEIMSAASRPIPFSCQVRYLKSLGQALMHAHHHNVYHRNLGPECVYVVDGRVVKLADFDFAKVVGMPTISRLGKVLLETSTSAPETAHTSSEARAPADIYSLGALWYFLALVPEKPARNDRPDFDRIDRLSLEPDARQLMKEMLAEAPDLRPQAIELVLDRLERITGS